MSSWVNEFWWGKVWMTEMHTGLRHSSALMGEQWPTEGECTNRRTELSGSRIEMLKIFSFLEGETEDVREFAQDHPDAQYWI